MQTREYERLVTQIAITISILDWGFILIRCDASDVDAMTVNNADRSQCCWCQHDPTCQVRESNRRANENVCVNERHTGKERQREREDYDVYMALFHILLTMLLNINIQAVLSNQHNWISARATDGWLTHCLGLCLD